LLFRYGARPNSVMLDVLEDLAHGERSPSCELFEIVGEIAHLALADSPSEPAPAEDV